METERLLNAESLPSALEHDYNQSSARSSPFLTNSGTSNFSRFIKFGSEPLDLSFRQTRLPFDTLTPSPEEISLLDNFCRVFRGFFHTNSRSSFRIKDKKKLSTFYGVFVPTWLSISGVLLFIRLAYCIGHAGILHTIIMFTLGMGLSLFTALSISALCTNGHVKDGGPYYLISRSLGVEFGGCLGFFFCLTGILQCTMNIFGFVEPFINHVYGKSLSSAALFQYKFLYGSLSLFVSTVICLFGANVFAKASIVFFAILVFCLVFIIISFFVQTPFSDDGMTYVGWNSQNFRENFFPDYSISYSGKTAETFSSIFGIIFPACAGILAGASMSGDLRTPSKAIPKGTLWAIGATYFIYILFTICLGATIDRDSLKNTFDALNKACLSGAVVQIAVYSSSLCGIISNVITAAKVFQAMALDNILPYMEFMQGSKNILNGEPVASIALTWFISQLLLFLGDINEIAPFISMFTLLCYTIINLACFLLKITSSPNFRPSFRYFRWYTALIGFFWCFSFMFVVSVSDGAIATVFMIALWVCIHFASSPKSWGDIQQALIYHQVRKYLLQLDVRKEHVKYWRPQILLISNSPTAPLPLIEFANCIKKGSLFIIGYIQLGTSLNLSICEDIKRIRLEWLENIEKHEIKGFFELTLAPNILTGTRSLLMNGGLGAMKPNILLLPWLESEETDACSRKEFVSLIAESSLLGVAVAVGRGFKNLVIPEKSSLLSFFRSTVTSIKFIDIYPFFLSDNWEGSFTMTLQIGCILNMVRRWEDSHKLRIIRVVENESETEGDKMKTLRLLDDLRIQGDVICVSLESLGLILDQDKNSVSSDKYIGGSLSLKAAEQDSRLTPAENSIFTELPAKIQNSIINKTMKLYSHPHQTSVIVSVLPRPPENSDNGIEFEKYFDSIDTLSEGAGSYGEKLSVGLPPVFLIHGQGVVVTSNL